MVVSLAEDGTLFPKRTAQSSAGCVSMVLMGLGTSFVVFVAVRRCPLIDKEESIALYPLKTKAVWFAGSRLMFS